MTSDLDAALYAALSERLRSQGLGSVAADLLALAQPAVRLTPSRVEDETTLALGASKVGGAPDLPEGTSWPTTADDAPLPFIAQIRLAEIAAYDPERALPHNGLLSFFYAMNDAAGDLRVEVDPTAWRVLWTHDTSPPLARLATPDALTDALDSHFPPCAIYFARRLTLPGVWAPTVAQIGLSEAEKNAYISVTSGADVGYLPEMDLRLLGYPYELEPPTFLAAYEAEHGGAEPEPPEQAQAREESLQALERLQVLGDKWAAPQGGFTSPWERARALLGILSEADHQDLGRVLRMSSPRPLQDSALQARAERDRSVGDEWRLLLQVYSNDQAEMDWAGGGVIHFGIKRAALAARDFSQVWVSLQFL